MRVLNAKIKNFGSYKELEFDFTGLGLSLVYGATGSGKSTLQDIIPWILFGITAKNGAVDEVRNWKADGNTIGVLRIEHHNHIIEVTRIRGASSASNDLYWTVNDHEEKIRGKDLSDTQHILEQMLSLSSDFYCTSTYFNEFSDTNNFFTAKAKDKRVVFEKIASLDLPIVLAEKTSNKRKEIKKELEVVKKEHAKTNGRLEQLIETRSSMLEHSNKWEITQQETIKELELKSKFFQKEKESKIGALQTKSYRFESDKHKKIEDLVDKLDDLTQKIKKNEEFDKLIAEEKRRMDIVNPSCPTCKRPLKESEYIQKLEKDKLLNAQYKERFSDVSQKIKEVQAAKNPYKDLIIQVTQATNHYDNQLDLQKDQINPFISQITEIDSTTANTAAIVKKLENKISDLEQMLDLVSRLYDLSFDLRGALLKKVILEIETKINDTIDKYFDSEFKVSFSLTESDDLNVDLYKNGYPCVFTQLSKGQRQILKLCFAVSVMQAAIQNSETHFNMLSFDEALDGLDSNLKVRAFDLFVELQKNHETILVIDHTPEFQNLFENKYLVSMIEDESIIIHE